MITCVAGLCLAASPPAGAAETLGFDPRHALAFEVLYERDIPAQTDPAQKRPAPKEPAWTIAKVEIANAGGNRFIFGVHFLEEYSAANGLLILYVDCDADPATGREGHGCERMLIVQNRFPSVTAYEADGSRGMARRPRAFVEGKTVWVSYDLDFPQRDGRSRFRLAVLSEKSDPHVAVDHVPYALHAGPPIGARPKVELPEDLVRSRGFGRVWGLRRIEGVLGGDGVARVSAADAERDGFESDKSEYRRRNVFCRRPGATLRVVPPAAGAFSIGVLVYDDIGADLIRVKIGQRTLGTIVGIWDDRKQHLLFSEERVALAAGDAICLESVGDGRHRIEEVVFLPRPPEAVPPIWTFRSISHFDGHTCFITSWPAICEIELEGGETLTEPIRTENHRFLLPGAREGRSVRYRIRARSPEGDAVVSDWLRYAVRQVEVRPQETPGSVALRVAPPVEIPAPGWPVTAGVPFPAGALRSASHVALYRDDREIPLQTEVTSTWHDGSVRWLLCDFRHEGGERTYSLRWGPRIEREHRTVDGEPPARVRLHLERADGKAFEAEVIPRPEERGSLRSVLRQEGHLRAQDGEAFFHYDIRFHVFPGLPFFRALVTLTAGETCSEWSEIRHVACDIRSLGKVDPGRIRVEQLRDDRYTATEGDGSARTGKRWDGPIGHVRVRDFWQNYPIRVSTDGPRTLFSPFPALSKDEYAWAEGTVDAHRLFFWFKDGAYRIRQGMSKTHELWIGLDGGAPALDRPLLAVCPPAWYAASGVFGEIAVSDPTPAIVERYDEKMDEALAAYLGNRERNREYGLFQFGDWWGEREINWGNIEYDTQHAFFLQFVRTGDPRFFRAAEEAELHNREIDTVLRHRDPARIGMVYTHSIGHVGDYYSKSPDPAGRGSPRTGTSVSHTWCEGHLEHYLFTGDRRSLDAARAIADHHDTYGLAGYDFTNTRIPGWHLILTLAVYRATRDPFYLNAAHIIVERVLERQTLEPLFGRPAGGWVRMMVPGHCHCEPFHYGNAGFMVGILLTGLRWYHRETGDARVAEAIVRGAKFLIEDMWVPERTGFRYTSCPKSSAGVWSNLPLADGLSYAYELSGDERIAEILRKAVPAGIEGISGFGKSFGQATRVAPHALARMPSR
ncbi:MAG: hypothetical protein JXP34_26080 [Planctomycetes bacterium]|nr:hypothetical protein [Planctomycetota bacterium]